MIWDNYYMKGCMSGMFGIVLSHPVDSIKTFYQTTAPTATGAKRATPPNTGLAR